MKIAIGCDDAGKPILQTVEELLRANEHIQVSNLSEAKSQAREHYPDVAERVALAVANGGYDRGILVCGTGIGMAITACKIPGVRAALCHDTYSAERSRKSNDAQVLTMGARVIGPELAKSIVEKWLESEFDDSSPSAPKVQRMREIDAKYLNPPGR